MNKIIFGALLTAAVATAASATDLTRNTSGFTYFNRPGATVAIHDADIEDCRKLAEGMHQPISPSGPTIVTSSSPVAAGVAGVLGDALSARGYQEDADRKAKQVNVENCMVAKGWRVVALDEAEGEAIAKESRNARSPKVLGWIGAAEPQGRVARVFANDAASNRIYENFEAAVRGGTPLSGVHLASDAYVPITRRRAVVPAEAPSEPRRPSSARPPEPLGDAELGGAPDGKGLIVVNVKGDAEITVAFERIGPDANAPAWLDGAPGEILVSRPAKTFAKAGAGAGATYVYAAPPGRWRLASVSVNWTPLSLCMGSPAFDIKAGDVIYAGSFDAARIKPDMALEPAKAAFPSVSNLPDKLKAAQWINGTRGKCEGAIIYAMEMDGSPFVDGYALGSRAIGASQH